MSKVIWEMIVIEMRWAAKRGVNRDSESNSVDGHIAHLDHIEWAITVQLISHNEDQRPSRRLLGRVSGIYGLDFVRLENSPAV